MLEESARGMGARWATKGEAPRAPGSWVVIGLLQPAAQLLEKRRGGHAQAGRAHCRPAAPGLLSSRSAMAWRTAL